MTQTDDKAPARILLIDDHPLLRRGITQLLEMEDSMTLAGEASSSKEGVRLAGDLDPDLILLDLNMPGTNGHETLRKLREDGFPGRIVIFTVSDAEDDVVAALRAGADGYLLKDMEPEDLMSRLHQAAVGKLVISDRLTTLLADALRHQQTPEAEGPDYASLTPREKDILRHIAEGLSNKMVARRLDISEGTVKVHVKHLLKKLGLRSRVEAAVWAVHEGYAESS